MSENKKQTPFQFEKTETMVPTTRQQLKAGNKAKKRSNSDDNNEDNATKRSKRAHDSEKLEQEEVEKSVDNDGIDDGTKPEREQVSLEYDSNSFMVYEYFPTLSLSKQNPTQESNELVTESMESEVSKKLKCIHRDFLF